MAGTAGPADGALPVEGPPEAAGEAGRPGDEPGVGTLAAGATGVDEAFEGVMARCLERLDGGEDTTVDELAEEHPEFAHELRRRLHLLVDAGFLEGGRVFGPYRLLHALGRGGMGVVYAARDEQGQRVVALKLLPSRLSHDKRALARFEREIKAAAQLDHAHIVPILGWGDEEGVPYYAMEYVAGRTLAQVIAALDRLGVGPEQLEAQHLDIAAPLEGRETRWGRAYVEAVCRLVVDVAEALEHAHGHGVVHRDVKPSNILLRDDGRALLFDFGLARVDTEASLTLTGDFTGTPHYTSPEQLSSRTEVIDGRSDVYSLGVTLYELVTLRRPFAGGSLQALSREILSCEPEPPRRFNASVPKDLETICLTAMDKNPARRYQRAAEMAADLRRLLDFRSIRARPVGPVTRLARWAHRNRAAATAVALAILLAVGTPLMLWRSNLQVRHEARKLARINAFLEDIFAAPRPHLQGSDATVVDVLDAAVARLGPDLGEDPATEGNLRVTIGTTYMSVAQYDRATEQYRAGLAQFDAAWGDAPRVEKVDAMWRLGRVLGLLRLELDEAEQWMLRALAMNDLLPGERTRERAGILTSLGHLASVRSDTARAREHLDEALQLYRDNPPASGPDLHLLRARLDLAGTYRVDQDLERAEQLMSEVLDEQRRHLPPEHVDVLETLRALASVYAHQGRFELAEARFRDQLGALATVLGEGHVKVARLRVLIARTHEARDQHAEAALMLEQAIPAMRRAYPDGHDHLADALKRMGAVHMGQDRLELALPYFAEAYQMYRRIWDDAHPLVTEAAINYAWLLQTAERYAEAEALLLEFRDSYAASHGEQHFLTAMLVQRLVTLYEAWGREDLAAELRAQVPADDVHPVGPSSPH